MTGRNFNSSADPSATLTMDAALDAPVPFGEGEFQVKGSEKIKFQTPSVVELLG